MSSLTWPKVIGSVLTPPCGWSGFVDPVEPDFGDD